MKRRQPRILSVSLSIACTIVILFLGACSKVHADDEQAVSVKMGVRIPMRDGVNLAATIFKPKDTEKPLPVILHFTPYIASRFSERALYLARRGYVVAAADVRGRGISEGEFKPFVNEGRDGYDVVEWLASQPWSNGKVTMIGGSYTGWNQWSVIKEFPPHLETITPAVSTFPGTEGIPKNRNIFIFYIMHWLNTASGVSSGPDYDEKFHIEKRYKMYRQHLPFNTLDRIYENTATEFQTWLKHPAVDSYWDAMSPSVEDYARINKPILTITGYYDADQTGAMTHYRSHMQHASPEARGKHYLARSHIIWEEFRDYLERREPPSQALPRAPLRDTKSVPRPVGCGNVGIAPK